MGITSIVNRQSAIVNFREPGIEGPIIDFFLANPHKGKGRKDLSLIFAFLVLIFAALCEKIK